MPTYCYRDTEEKIHTRVFSMKDEIPKEIVVEGGLTAVRDLQAEHADFVHCPGNWPQVCHNAFGGRHQVPVYGEFLRKAGVPTEFTKDGAGIFTDREHRSRALKALGMYDRSAGYKDPTPTTHTGD